MLKERSVRELENRFHQTSSKSERDAISHLLAANYKYLMTKNMEPYQSNEKGDAMLVDFDYLVNVIESCNTSEQLASAKKAIANFDQKWRSRYIKKKNDNRMCSLTACRILRDRIEKVRILKNIKL